MAVLEAFSETGEIKGLLTMNSYRELDRWERGEHVGGMTDELAQNLTLGKPGVGQTRRPSLQCPRWAAKPCASGNTRLNV